MREILFRGKRKDNGEWVEGGILQTPTYTAICVYSDYHEWHEFIEVIPETIFEFIGLTDKNGKKLFEGDIVKHYNKIYIGAPNYYTIALIEWNKEKYRYQQRKKDGEIYFISKDCVFEVIGNIHDNADLLKGNEGK